MGCDRSPAGPLRQILHIYDSGTYVFSVAMGPDGRTLAAGQYRRADLGCGTAPRQACLDRQVLDGDLVMQLAAAVAGPPRASFAVQLGAQRHRHEDLINPFASQRPGRAINCAAHER
jgi:hypothetical protein